MINISEIFFSYQGEGVRTGYPSIFVRVAGCNFAIEGHPCKWNGSFCDTGYAQQKNQGDSYTNQNIIQEIGKISKLYNCKEIVITGGEPLACGENMYDLIEELLTKYTVTVQTNGSQVIWPTSAIWAMDIKCPSSGNSEYNRYENFKHLKKKDQIKFVISDIEDYKFAKSKLPLIKHATVLFQPAWKMLSVEHLVDWIKMDKLGKIHLSTQCQKYWFGDQRRKV
jgi:7-carboxy-7-deazaguanine synthase